MGRNCRKYVSNKGTCGGGYGADDGPYVPLSTAQVDRILSDPTGKRNGPGRSRNCSTGKCDTKEMCERLITSIKVKIRDGQGNVKLQPLEVNKNLVGEITEIFNEICNETGYKITGIGCYQYRYTMKNGKVTSERLSEHSYGAAIDINPHSKGNPFFDPKSNKDNKHDDDVHIRTENHAVVKIFKRHGWGWGGKYGDTMHFSKNGGY